MQCHQPVVAAVAVASSTVAMYHHLVAVVAVVQRMVQTMKMTLKIELALVAVAVVEELVAVPPDSSLHSPARTVR